MHGHSTRFSPILDRYLQPPFFSLIFPPESTTSLKIFRGVGPNAGIFSEGSEAGLVLGSRWGSAGRMGPPMGGGERFHYWTLKGESVPKL